MDTSSPGRPSPAHSLADIHLPPLQLSPSLPFPIETYQTLCVSCTSFLYYTTFFVNPRRRVVLINKIAPCPVEEELS
jgi:hypothetical protein